MASESDNAVRPARLGPFGAAAGDAKSAGAEPAHLPVETRGGRKRVARAKQFPFETKLMVVLWLASLPLVNLWVRNGSEGVGYYAYIQAAQAQRNLNLQRTLR